MACTELLCDSQVSSTFVVGVIAAIHCHYDLYNASKGFGFSCLSVLVVSGGEMSAKAAFKETSSTHPATHPPMRTPQVAAARPLARGFGKPCNAFFDTYYGMVTAKNTRNVGALIIGIGFFFGGVLIIIMV